MRALINSMVVAAGIAAVGLAARAQDPNPATRQADVPVKEVVLFSSGVGYFEHFGTVRGDGATELRFKTAQINDILKSLVLQDMDGGKVSTITYASQDPIGKTLASFQVNISANPPLADLLNQLRGAKVSIDAGGTKLSGTILGVEKKQRPVGEKGNPVEVAVMNLLSGGTIRSIELDTVRTLDLEDAQLQEELNKALTALSQARDQDKKPVTINFRGEGERRVRIGYVVETPIWKTSYRLILPSDDVTRPKLQGWAIVENQTDNDWNNVQLSLVSGRPISFVMDLYQPLYIPRPVEQMELYASLRPQTYEGGIELKDKEAEKFAGRKAAYREEARARGGAGGLAPGAAADAAPMPAERAADEQLGKALDATASVASVASASKVGELFQYTVGNVSLPRQKSAMLPIITDDVEVERLSIYNQSVLARNPLNGARVKNTTDKHLLQGPITVLDGASYAGDAKIDNLPPGQERLLSYGIDLQMTVDATKNNQENAIRTGKIVKGVMQVVRKYVSTQEYLAENKSDHEKTMIIEHPLRPGWKLVDTDKPIETTERLYRFKGAVGSKKQSKLVVKEELVQGEEFAILPADMGTLEFYSRTGEIPKAVRDALQRVLQLKQAVVETERQINENNTHVQVITAEQNRIRENMKTVAPNSEYYNRLMKKLNDQETQIEQLQSTVNELTQKRAEQQKELENFLNNLSVE